MKKACIDTALCVGCGACIAACPSGAVVLCPGWHSRVDLEKCTGCGTCVRICHKGAPTFIEATDEG